MKHSIFVATSLIASLYIVGCGNTTTDHTTPTTSNVSENIGYFIDAAVENLDYECLDDHTKGTTGKDGNFTCQHMQNIRFKVGGITLGELKSLPSDKKVFPQDLLGVSREGNISNENVVVMAQFLQSLDSDHNVSNGIYIDDKAKEALDEEENFDPDEILVYASIADIPLVSEFQAEQHLRESIGLPKKTIQTTHTGPNGDKESQEQEPSIPPSSLSPRLKEALAYMGNEERLAYDIYMNLYSYHSSKGTTITQLANIAQNSETRHISWVQALVKSYEIDTKEISRINQSIVSSYNMSPSSMPSGIYDIAEIQSLYNSLYSQGKSSKQAALEVGCMVEVVDIRDLEKYIVYAKEDNANDIEGTFTALLNGSYSHYNSFDRALKAYVDNGCCSLGSQWCLSQ